MEMMSADLLPLCLLGASTGSGCHCFQSSKHSLSSGAWKLIKIESFCSSSVSFVAESSIRDYTMHLTVSNLVSKYFLSSSQTSSSTTPLPSSTLRARIAARLTPGWSSLATSTIEAGGEVVAEVNLHQAVSQILQCWLGSESGNSIMMLNSCSILTLVKV